MGDQSVVRKKISEFVLYSIMSSNSIDFIQRIEHKLDL
jgi:hypothetical protein